MSLRNRGCEFDSELAEKTINFLAAKQRAEIITSRRTVKKNWQAAWLLKAITCIDLTTLCGDDTFSNVQRLCTKAVHPIQQSIIDAVGMSQRNIATGAVCVYPARVYDAVSCIKSLNAAVPVASVATGFPSGQYHLKTRLQEIQLAVEDGAAEIDIVINRAFALEGNWKEIYNEVKKMKEACGNAHLKTILATGELGTFSNIYKASMICMMAGADFIKTSTGKESVNAILPVGLVMTRAIKDYHDATGYKVGFKPAGGIRTAKEMLTWQYLMKEELGNEWLEPNLFRVGASSLLGDIERQLYHHVTGRYANISEFPIG